MKLRTKIAGKLALTTALLTAGHAMAQGTCGPATTLSPIPQYSLTFQVCGSDLVGSVTTIGTGWAAFGFGRDQFMPETDVFMAGVLDGVAYGQDAFALQRTPPSRDASQDVRLFNASEVNGVTSFSFSRPLNTGDSVGDFDLTSGSYFVLMAYQATSDSLTVRHSWSDASDQPYFFTPVPEPGSLLMMLGGLGLLASSFIRKR